jgi:signal transduction histidine kinase
MDAHDHERAPGREAVLERVFADVSAVMAVKVSIAFVVVMAVIDRVTGPGVSLAPFSLVPVMLVTWTVGWKAGAGVALLATVASQIAHVERLRTVPVAWNSMSWLAVLLLTVWLVTTLRSAVQRRDHRLAAEAETSDELRQQNALKDTLLHAVSHDLKGPLAGILGAMQTIRRAEQLRLSDTEMNDLYGVIEQAGAKAARLVDDLLDLDRLGRGQLQPEREPTDVRALARRLTTEVATLAGHPVRVEGDNALVDVDAAKVERVIENLLVNAGRHTAPGTPVHVHVHVRPNGVVLTVDDEGDGVPDDLKDAIFEPFRQGENPRGGVGIGLSLVRRFAELHGGTAHVEDRAGGGARFVVVIPGAVVGASDAPSALHAV